jgi:hypothetical protein
VVDVEDNSVFSSVAPFSLVQVYDVSEALAASIIRVMIIFIMPAMRI